jgi:hypothetical protein
MGPKRGGGTSQKKFLILLSEAPSALVLSPQVIELAGQSLDGSGDIPNIIAGDHLAIEGHGWRIGLAPCVWTVRLAVPLVSQVEGIPEPEVGAAAIRIAPEGWGILSDGRDRAEDAGDQDYGSHGHSMARGLRSVEGSHG